MKTLTKLFFSCLIIVSFAVQAKESADIASLNTALEEYKKVQISGDLKKSLDYAYPAIFKIVSKETMLQGLEQATKSGMAPKFISLEQKADLPVKTYSKGIFTTVPYSMEMSMRMAPENADEDKKAKMAEMLKDPAGLAKFSDFMKKMLEMSMGKGAEISFDKETLRFNIKRKGSYIAINEDKSGWKFMDTTPNPMIKVDDILPKDILEQLKK